MLERTGEQRSLGSQALQLDAVVAEPDDHGPHAERANGVEQHVDTLVVEELAEVEDRRLIGREESFEPLRVALVG